MKNKNFSKMLCKQGYLKPENFYKFIKTGIGDWQLGGICPFCNTFQLAIVKCKDVKKYNEIWNRIKQENE